MAAGSAYNSRELAHLQKAQTTLWLMAPNCTRLGSSGTPASAHGARPAGAPAPSPRGRPAAAPDTLLQCAPLVADDLLKFKAAWDAKRSMADQGKDSAETIRHIFGDLEKDESGARRLGVVPILAIVGACIGAIAILYSVYKPRKGTRGEAALNGIATAMVVGISVTVVMAVSWTYGLVSKHQALAYQAELTNDTDPASSDPGGKIFNNPTFARIWQACNTESLRQVYNCSNGLEANTNLAPLPAELTRTYQGLTRAAATCAGSGAVPAAPDSVILDRGLKTLYEANLDDFDAALLKRRIQEGVARLKALLSPQAGERAMLSDKDLLSITLTDVAAAFKDAKYLPASDAERTAKQAAFINDMDGYMVPQVTGVIMEFWPQLDPEAHMSQIDDALAEYYSYTGNNTFYADYLREFVLTVIRVAVQGVSSSLSLGDGRFVPVAQFVRTNWGRVVATNQVVRVNILRLFTDVCRYTDTFVSNSQPAATLWSDLLGMYTRCAFVIVVLALMLYVVKFMFLRKPDMVRKAAGLGLGDGQPGGGGGPEPGKLAKLGAALGSAEGWYARLDFFKYLLLGVMVAMLLLTMLSVVNKNVQSRVAHNHNALYQNSMRLKAAAWSLVLTVNPINCVNPDRYRDVDPISYQACAKGGTQLTRLQAVAGQPGLPGADAAAEQTKAIVLSDSATATDFYHAAVKTIAAYESCNLITKSGGVPFPTAEFIVLVVCLLVCVLGCVYLTFSASPRKQITDIRDMLRLRSKLSALVGSVPPTLQAELDSKLKCFNTNADVFSILSFSVVLVLFILSTVLVTNFNRSSNAYRTALSAYSANECV